MYRLRWKRSALNDLAGLWLAGDAALRAAITRASDAVERQLTADPFGASESRDNRRRILFIQPLGVLFQVDEANSTVNVLQVWQY